MLIAFSVGNYRSFKEQATLSMVAANISSKPKQLDSNNVFSVDDELKLLTSAAIYGANASGKSNLVAALRFMRTFVLTSQREMQRRQTIAVQPFLLNSETERQPSFFEVVFVYMKVIYRYGFTISNERVEEEWLYATRKREGYLFTRTGDDIKVNPRSFKEGSDLEKRTRGNALFLSVVAQWNGDIAGHILDWFTALAINSGVEDAVLLHRMSEQLEQLPFRKEVLALIKELDLGINEIQIERQPDKLYTTVDEEGDSITVDIPGDVEIITHHLKYDAEGKMLRPELFSLFQHESQGTQRLFILAAPLIRALQKGSVVVVDELDARLHPLLTCTLIKLFNSCEINPHHAQLVFTTHDTNLLSSDLLRRDQIWFVEKSQRGESTLYSLAEYRERNDASFEKNYIQGRYGAIPFIGNLSNFMGDVDAQAEGSDQGEPRTKEENNQTVPTALTGE